MVEADTGRMEDDNYVGHDEMPRERRRHLKRPFVAGALTMGLLVSGGVVADRIWNQGRAYQLVGDAADHLPGVAADVTGEAEGDAATPEDAGTTGAAESEAAARNASCIAELPLDTRIGQLLIIGVQGDGLEQATPLFQSRGIGGAIIMSSPTDPRDGSIEAFSNATDIPVLMSTDEEGGARDMGGVQRFRNLGELPLATDTVDTMTPQQLTQIVQEHGRQMADIGIDMVFGPVVDVDPVSGEGPLPGRVYSSDPTVVAAYAGAVTDGWQSAGILPTYKHFPGLGGGTENTDYETSVTPPLEDLRKHDLIPYETLADSGAAVMVGNQIVPGLTQDLPASLSRPAIDLLRDELGYKDALVVTDSLNAAAISNTTEAIKQSIAAGVDMAMVVDPPEGQTMGAIVDTAIADIEAAVAAGEISQEEINDSVARVLAAKDITDACTLAD